MKHKNKINFLKVLIKLTEKMDIEDLLFEQLKNKVDHNIKNNEIILLDFIKSSEDNIQFLQKLISFEIFNIEEIIKNINNRINDNENNIIDIKKEHIILYKISFLTPNALDEKNKIAITKDFINRILHLINNYNNTKIQSIINVNLITNKVLLTIFKGTVLIKIFFFNILNFIKDDDKAFENYIKDNQIRTKLLNLLAIYILTSKKINNKEVLLPLSLVSIFTNTFNIIVRLKIGTQVNTKEIFELIIKDDELIKDFDMYINEINEFNLLYDFLNNIEQNLEKINNEYTIIILKSILKKIGAGDFQDKLLIDYYILFSNKVLEEYKKVIKNKNKENKYWYKKFVIDNIKSDNEILHKETLLFLNFINNWQDDEEIKQEIIEFINKNNKHLLSKNYIFNIVKNLINKKYRFNFGYHDEVGEILFKEFKNLKKDNEHLKYAFKNLKYLLKKETLDTLMNNILENVKGNVSNINEYQLIILKLILSKEFSSKYFNKDEIKKIFDKVISEKNGFNLLKVLIEYGQITKNNTYFTEELTKIYKNETNKEVKTVIETILSKLKTKD